MRWLKNKGAESGNQENEKNLKNGEKKGKNNLIILGVVSVLIAMTMTGISLIVYHNSGDIYLDRSRPGYLPDEGEKEEEPEVLEYDFSKSGKLTKEIIQEYLEKLEVEVKAMSEYEKPFSNESLSDEVLGIPKN